MAISWDGAIWTASTAYAVNARVVNAGNVYQCITSGTSAGSGGPTTTASDITDGTCHWKYKGAYNLIFVTGVAPDLASGSPTITAGAQALFLALAEELVADPAVWLTDTLMDAGRAYLAAHFGQLSRLRGHGPVTSEAVGPVSRGYASMQGPFAIHLTSAGQAYMDLVRTTPAVFGVNL